MAGYDSFATPVVEDPQTAQGPNPYAAFATPVAVSAAPQTLRDRYKDEIRAGVDDVLPAPSTLGLVQRLMSDPFGIQDETVGAGRYIGKLISSGGDTAAANQAYNEGAERVRAEKDVAREKLGPVLSTGAELLGGFGTSGPGKAIALVRQAPNLAGRVIQSAKAAAPIGFASGFGNAEGGFGNRLIGGTEGMGTAAALGPVVTEVGAPVVNALYNGAKSAPNAVGNALNNIIPGTRVNIDQRLLAALRRQNQTPADLANQMAQDQANATFGGTQMDIPLTLADSGPAMRNLAYTIKAQPGQAATEAEALVEGRQRGDNGFSSQYDRMSEATRRALQVTRDNAARTEDKLTAARKSDADVAYDAFRNHPGTIPIDDILEQNANDIAGATTSSSDIAKAIDDAHNLFTDVRTSGPGSATQMPSRTQEARFKLQQMDLDDKITKAQAAGDQARATELQNLKNGLQTEFAGKTQPASLTTTDLTPAQFDVAKQQLDDKIRTAQRAGDNYKAAILTDLQKKLIARADQATTIQTPNGPQSLYANARQSFSTPTQTLDALEAGKNFLSTDPDRIGSEYGALNTPQKRAYRGGAANTLVNKFGDKTTGVNVTQAINTPNVQKRLGAITTGPNLDKLNAIADQENRMFQTRNRLVGGSKTNENQNLTQDFTLATRLGHQLRAGQVFGAVGDLVASTLQRVYRFREQDARLLARDLFETDPVKRTATINRLQNAYGNITPAIRTAIQIAQHRAAGRSLVAPIVGNALAPNRADAPQNALYRNAR